MIKITIRGLMLALAATALMSPGVRAQLTNVAPACTDFDGFENQFGSVSYFQCGGAFAGNNANLDITAWILDNWGFETTFGGTTDAGGGEAGPFEAFPQEEATGTLVFDEGIYGDFVLALKSGDSFSIYHFVDVDGWESLTYSTLGAGVNDDGTMQALSHASIYAVPEPTVALLLLTGVLGLGLVTRRRDGVSFT